MQKSFAPNCNNQSVSQVGFNFQKPNFGEFVHPMIPQARVNNKRIMNNITNFPQNNNLLCQNFIGSKFESIPSSNFDFNQNDYSHEIPHSYQKFDYLMDAKHRNINDIEQRDFELKKLSDNLELLKSENQSLLNKKSALNIENSEIPIQIEQRKTDLIYFETQLHEIREKSSDVTIQTNKFHDVYEEFIKMKNFMENDKINLESKIQNYSDCLENDMNFKLRTVFENIEITTHKIDELKNSNNKLCSENDQLKCQFTNFKIDHESYVEQLLEKNENIKQINFELNEDIANLNIKIEEFIKKSQSLENDNGNLRQEISRLTDVSERKEESEILTKNVKAELEGLQDNIFEFEKIISELKINLTEEDSKTIESNEKLIILNGDFEQNLKLETEIKANIEQLSNKIEEFEVNKFNLMETIDNLESKLSGVNLTNLELGNIVENLRNTFKNTEIDKGKHSNTIENLHHEFTDIKERNRILTEELNCLKENKNNKLSISIFEIQNFNLVEEVKKHYFDYKFLKNKLDILSIEKPKQLQSEKVKLENCTISVNNQIKIIEQKTEDHQVKFNYLEQSQQALNVIREQLNKMIQSKDNYQKIIAEKDEEIKELDRKNNEYLEILKQNNAEKDNISKNFLEIVNNAEMMYGSTDFNNDGGLDSNKKSSNDKDKDKKNYSMSPNRKRNLDTEYTLMPRKSHKSPKKGKEKPIPTNSIKNKYSDNAYDSDVELDWVKDTSDNHA